MGIWAHFWYTCIPAGWSIGGLYNSEYIGWDAVEVSWCQSWRDSSLDDDDDDADERMNTTTVMVTMLMRMVMLRMAICMYCCIVYPCPSYGFWPIFSSGLLFNQ